MEPHVFDANCTLLPLPPPPPPPLSPPPLPIPGVWQRTQLFLNGKNVTVQSFSEFEPGSAENPAAPAQPGVPNGTNRDFFHGHWEGYLGFSVRIDNSSALKYGDDDENVLAVHVDAAKGSGWWYEGGGIYRPVHIVSAPLVHFEPDGLFAPALLTGPPVANGRAPTDGQTAPARVDVSALIRSFATVQSPGGSSYVAFSVVDEDGNVVANSTASVGIVPAASASVAPAAAAAPAPAPAAAAGSSSSSNSNAAPAFAKASMAIAKAELWSIGRPYLYTVTATLLPAGDSVNTTIGVRSFGFAADTGMTLNGEAAKVRGFCDHNDFGGVGMAVPDRIKLYRAQQLRSVGGNGRRMSHNPPQPMMLDIYDRLGVMVMDENRLFGNTSTLIANIADLVRRDRNHPSIMSWNFSNEGGCNGEKWSNPKCVHTYSTDPHCICRDAANETINACASGSGFRDAVYSLDGTRVVLGNEEPPLNPTLQPYTDIQGFSHRSGS